MSSFEWPISKLELVNSALSQCGDALVNVPDDGSDEWLVCSPAYERAMAVLIEDGSWGFATKVAQLTQAGNAPADTTWDTAFVLPQDLVHIIWVKIDQSGNQPRQTLYDILANQLVINAQGGPPPPIPPVAPSPVTMKYVSSDNADLTAGTPLFVAALQCFVMSAIYRGLHGEPGEADKLWAAGESFAQRARTRYAQQTPKRQLWNSRTTASRRIRRPWPPIGNNGWGGSGIPG